MEPQKRTARTPACLRCRRLRTKCTYSCQPPCNGCLVADLGHLCALPSRRGTSQLDRQSLRSRKRALESTGESSGSQKIGLVLPTAQFTTSSEETPAKPMSTSSFQTSGIPSPSPISEAAPIIPAVESLPLETLTSACENFFSSAMQLDVLHKPSFMNRLKENPNSINPFLLYSMLSISARFTPELVQLFGSPDAAVTSCVNKASTLLFGVLNCPSLDIVQGVYFLAICEWGRGEGYRARILHSMALQVAQDIRLGSVVIETHNAIEIEKSRRTRWFLWTKAITMHHNSSKIGTEASYAPLDVPLPSLEQDFQFGSLSPVTHLTFKSVEESPEGPSLFCVLLSIIAIWGRTIQAMEAPEVGIHSAMEPWASGSAHRDIVAELGEWLGGLRNRQKWSKSNLLAYHSKNQDLALTSIWMNFHVINLAIRRRHLPTMITSLHPNRVSGPLPLPEPPEGRAYWVSMADTLYAHVFDLLEVVEAGILARPLSKGCTAHTGFATYFAGTMLHYLRCCPWLCPARADEANMRLHASQNVLESMREVWPICEQWAESLGVLASICWPEIESNTRQRLAVEHVNGDISLDPYVGIYRQYATKSGVSHQSPRPPIQRPEERSPGSSLDPPPGSPLTEEDRLAMSQNWSNEDWATFFQLDDALHLPGLDDFGFLLEQTTF